MAATDLGTENSEANLAIESPEEVDAQIVQITQDAKILNSSGEELGEVLTNTILPVKQIGEGLFEILGELDVINSSDDKLLLKDPSFIVQTEEVASSNCESCTEDNYVEESLSFEQGMTLYQDSEKNTAVMHLNSSLTIPAYYKDQDLIIIKWNEQVYYVETGSTEPSVISDEEPVDVVEEQNSAPSESSVEQSTPYSTEAQQANSSSVQTKVSPSFKATDKYFEVTEDQVVVYDNSGGSLKPVGYLIKGQVYPRVSDYGDWHQIKFGNQYAYVWEAATKVATGNAIQNENKGSANTTRFFIADEDLAVYDNTSGSLVPFAKLNKGIKYPIISDLGDWLKIDVAGRIGYVYSPAVSMDFLSSDKYFEVKEDKVPIYDNSGGSLKPVGYLIKGQVYPRVSDYGDWHQIKFGNQYAYVWKAATKAATGSAIQNENKGLVNTTRVFTADEDLAVYDNTSGSLVPFAKLNKGTKYPLISDMGDWLKIDVAGRIGYVYSPAVSMDFLPSDKYFEVKEDQIAIYDNSGGSLKPVGYLIKGQAYPRVSDYGDWHQIKFGNQYAYVWKAATKVASGSVIQNENKGLANTTRVFTANEDLAVYDNTSGSLVPFAKLNKGMKYPLISDMGDWLKIDVAGRIGYVYSPAVSIDFLPSDKYFEVKEEQVPVYDNSGGTLKPVGYLKKGQVYLRVSDYGDWHQVKIGQKYAYVWKAATKISINPTIPNENKSFVTKDSIGFKALSDLAVYDNTSGSLVEFGFINKDQEFTAISEYGGDWLKVNYLGRVGYVYRPATEMEYLLPLHGKTIVLDPGHGGSDSGAVGNGITEKNLNLNVSLALKAKLESMGAKVILTRSTDVFIPLNDRPLVSQNVNADLFVSIHTNSSTSSSATGVETYYSEAPYNGENNPYPIESKRLAQSIQNHLTQETYMRSRGIDDAGFIVIRKNIVPSVLVELGFLSSPSDATIMLQSDYKDKAAQGILLGILEYFQ
ncbi:N-acetylmuramoyl-L-alanine amidase [Bacillaceae bacterium CLA-AA-H227]|uniref:N-acetylmuramoyl-L-alanine amidase n=1 Tax=Robertmurraya yapensis (ex Hitch et al 2024) TaxID=3133160 RepID=A0ACC6SEW3_9BACI